MSSLDRARKFMAGKTGRIALTLLPLAVASLARADSVSSAFGGGTGGGNIPCGVHVTDGAFTTPAEWDTSRATVSKSFFPVNADSSGGASVYVEQGFCGINAAAAGGGGALGNTLFLMYDYWNSPNVFPNGVTGTSFFDIFFQVPSEGEDYLMRIFAGTNNFEVYEKPEDQPSTFNADGSFNVNAAPWSSADDDIAAGKFETALGMGTSPDSSTPHMMAEFQLSIDNSPPGQPSDGLYSPDPAFWSGGVNSGANDPPISSDIFHLNPDGTTTVTPVTGPNGDPVQQDNVTSVPEPSSLLLFGSCAGLALLKLRKR
jgi:hypothetical protein